MHSIKKELIAICEEVMEHNNKPYIESEGGINNHIFDEKGVQMYVGLELTKKLNLYNNTRKLHNLQFEKKSLMRIMIKKIIWIFFYFTTKKKLALN